MIESLFELDGMKGVKVPKVAGNAPPEMAFAAVAARVVFWVHTLPAFAPEPLTVMPTYCPTPVLLVACANQYVPGGRVTGVKELVWTLELASSRKDPPSTSLTPA